MDIEKTRTIPCREKLFLLWNSVQRIVSDPNVEDSRQTEDHENRIRRQYNQLLSNLNVPDVVTQMFQSGKLTAKEHEHLRQFESTPIRASEELLTIIIMNSRDVYECFLESLKKTKQHHVYQMLTSDEELLCIGEQSVSEHSRLIRQNYECLTESLDPDSGLLTTLYAKEVLSQREYGQIFFVKERFMKNEMLLSIISRKSVDDFKKFIIAMNDTSQEHIARRLVETPVDDENENVAPTVIKIFSATCSDSLGKRMPPKLPPKPKKQPPTTPSSKPMVIKPKPLLEPNIHPSKPNRLEKQRNVIKHKIMKKRSVDYLEAKLRELPSELQTDVSTKLVLIHRRTSKDSIWNITFTKILEESQNIKRQNIMQAKAADENCDRLMQEISKRERECKIIKEDIHREKTITKKQLRELHETVCELEYRRNLVEIQNRNLFAKLHELEDRHKLTENDNRNLLAKLKKSEVEVEGLLLLNKRKEQEVYEKVSIIEKLEGQATHSETKLKEMEAEFMDTRDKLIEKELALTETTTKLKETQERLPETKAKLTVTQKGTGNMRSEDVETTFLDLKQDLEKERKFWTEERKELMKQAQELQEESSDVKVTLFELKQQLEEERKVWEEEREQLIKQTQEMHKELPAEIPDKYKSDPVLVQTIIKKFEKKTNILGIKLKSSSKEENTAIRGMAILDKELFVVSAGSSTAEVYDSNNFSSNRRWSLKELINPMDMGSCKRNNCLYIFSRPIKGHLGQTNEILKVDPNGKLINKWPTGHDWGWDMSVTDESHVILTVCWKNKLNEYSPDGQLIREIKLSSDAGFSYPWHAIKLTNGHFLVSHGGGDDALHRVCVLDADGNLKKSFGGKCGSAIGQMKRPVYLSVDRNGFVMVVDQLNRRVLLLDSDLKFKREIISTEEKYGLRIPWNILLDESNGRLLVTDNDMNMRILIFEFR